MSPDMNMLQVSRNHWLALPRSSIVTAAMHCHYCFCRGNAAMCACMLRQDAEDDLLHSSLGTFTDGDGNGAHRFGLLSIRVKARAGSCPGNQAEAQ